MLTPADPASTARPLPQLGAATGATVSSAPVPWSSGLCDCFSDLNSCCLTYWCPCIAFGRISEIVDQGSTSSKANRAIYLLMLIGSEGLQGYYTFRYRSKIRQQYNLGEAPCGDTVVHSWCEQCAICQEYRELESRGFDLKLGWQGNFEKMNSEIAMAPIVQQGMTR